MNRLGFGVRLPYEWEWQWAAQSAHPGLRYPWGPDWRGGLANTRENQVRLAIITGVLIAIMLNTSMGQRGIVDKKCPEDTGPEETR